MSRSLLVFSILCLIGSFNLNAAPPILSYAGQVSVNGQPFTGTGQFKFAFVDGQGRFSYWSHDGTSAAGSEPTGSVSLPVSTGLYSVMLGDTALSGMSAIDEAVFQNHNDVHLRIWFSDGINGFEQLSPDRRFASVPYVLGNDVTGSANLADASGSGGGGGSASTQRVTEAGGYMRLVADGPNAPSSTLVLLDGDTAEVLAYVGEEIGLLEYSFGEHGFVLPRSFDSFRQTLIGPGSVRLIATTGSKSFANLRVHRANGRDHLDLDGGATSGSQPPAIVSIPKEQTVVLGGKTTLFVSASGDNLTYQWKKDGQNMAGATSAALTFNEARPQDSGNYTVVVSNADGNVTSSVAQLVVDTLMKAVPAGTYRINADPDNAGHEVALSTYLIDMFEVRMSYWEEVYEWATQNGYAFTNPGLNTDPSGVPQSGDHPVHSISWYDCVKWANARSEKDGFEPCYYADENRSTVYRSGEINLTNFHVDWTASGYRLPTEAEWEVAARGGLVANKYAWGNSPFPSKANYVDTRIGKSAAVGTFDPNGYGIHDVGGNLRERTWDIKDDRTYEYEWKETFPDEDGYYGLVDLNASTSILTNQGYSGFDRRHFNLIKTTENGPSEVIFDYNSTNEGNGTVIPEIFVLSRADGGTTEVSVTQDFGYDGDPGRVLSSGTIGHNGQTLMETKVMGPGTLSFDWTVSSEGGYDWLRFYIDNAEQDLISGSENWQSKTYSITSGEKTLAWSYSKDGGGTSGSDSGSIRDLTYNGGPASNYQPSPTMSAFGFLWSTGGNSNWSGFSNNAPNAFQDFSISNQESSSRFSLKKINLSSTPAKFLKVSVSNPGGDGYVYVPKVPTLEANATNHQAYLELKVPVYRDAYEQYATTPDFSGNSNDFLFEFMDGGAAIRGQSDFGKYFAVNGEIGNPPSVRYYLPKPKTKDSIGDSIEAVYLKINDPKSLWTGTDRIVKDRAYNQSLNKLTARIGNGTGLNQDDTGFRLVRRP